MLRDHLADYAAVAAWIVFTLVITVWRNHVAQPQISYIGAATLTLSGLAIARRHRTPRLKPGEKLVRLAPDEHVISGQDLGRLESSVIRGYREARDEQGGTRLLSAS